MQQMFVSRWHFVSGSSHCTDMSCLFLPLLVQKSVFIAFSSLAYPLYPIIPSSDTQIFLASKWERRSDTRFFRSRWVPSREHKEFDLGFVLFSIDQALCCCVHVSGLSHCSWPALPQEAVRHADKCHDQGRQHSAHIGVVTGHNVCTHYTYVMAAFLTSKGFGALLGHTLRLWCGSFAINGSKCLANIYFVHSPFSFWKWLLWYTSRLILGSDWFAFLVLYLSLSLSLSLSLFFFRFGWCVSYFFHYIILNFCMVLMNSLWRCPFPDLSPSSGRRRMLRIAHLKRWTWYEESRLYVGVHRLSCLWPC